MSQILVSGAVNIETTLRVEAFPVAYTPVQFPFFGMHSAVSGVGYTAAKALTALGNPVKLLATSRVKENSDRAEATQKKK